jgi:hypothetical protein
MGNIIKSICDAHDNTITCSMSSQCCVPKNPQIKHLKRCKECQIYIINHIQSRSVSKEDNV